MHGTMQLLARVTGRTAAIRCHSSPAGSLAETAGPPSSSRVWLVGAGLGPAEYLTLKAVQLIKQADVIVYDDLGTEEALGFASEQSEKIYVGKRGGKPSMKQAEIDALLVQACAQGHRKVVRLKGGDPAVFSRGSSEATALAAAGVPFEFVPGISSALAAPLLAGLPLTDAKLGFSFAVVSGHDVEGTDWSAFSRIPTLVVLMAGRNLSTISDKLLACGWDGATPVMIVRSAGLPSQKTWETVLARTAKDTEGEDLSPCVVIVGRVAGLPSTWRASADAAGSPSP